MRIGYRLTQEEATYKDKQIQNRLEVQTGNKQFVPQIISTPFFENRYHKIADLADVALQGKNRAAARNAAATPANNRFISSPVGSVPQVMAFILPFSPSENQ